MTKKMLHIGEGLSLPAEEFLSSATGIYGKRGRGKSGAVKRTIEELDRVGLPFILFDPAGVHWAAASSADGKSPGLPVLVIGGKHGHLPLNRKAGAEVARAVVEQNVSVIVDFKSEPKAAYREFIRDFCHELFHVEGSPRVVIIEEAARLVPQKLRPDMAESFEAVEKLVTQGRNEGIGVVLVGQRPAMTNKDVLSEVDSLLIFGLVSPQDRKAIREWVEAKGDEDKLAEFDAGVASLRQREAWFWSPEAYGGDIFRRTTILPFRTLHGDRTHLRKLNLLDTRPVLRDVTPLVEALGAKLSSIKDERADASKAQATIRELRAKVERFEHDARKFPTQFGQSKRDVARITDEATKPFREEAQALRNEYAKLRAWADKVYGIVKKLGDLVSPPPEKSEVPRPKALGPSSLSTERQTEALSRGLSSRAPLPPPTVYPFVGYTAPKDAPDSGDRPLVRGERMMLTALVRVMPKGLTHANLATLSGMSPRSGSFSTYIARIVSGGYAARENGEYRATDKAVEAIGSQPPLATHEDIVQMWMSKLVAGERRMLQALLDKPDYGLTRDELASAAGMSVNSGSFSTYLGRLNANGLIEKREGLFYPAGALWP